MFTTIWLSLKKKKRKKSYYKIQRKKINEKNRNSRKLQWKHTRYKWKKKTKKVNYRMECKWRR